MNLFTLIKNTGLKIVRRINEGFDPFDELTREVFAPDDKPLWLKADFFEDQIREVFWNEKTLTFYYRLSYGTEDWDFGDQALWQGIYTAMRAWKFAVTKTDEDAADLHHGLMGASAHHYGPRRWLVRGWNPNDPENEFRDDASPDSATGHLCGLYFAWMHGTGATKSLAAQLLDELAAELVNNNYCLVNQNATPTTYGKLIQGPLTDPHRAALALAILSAAARATDSGYYRKHFHRLWKSHGALIRSGDFKFLWLTKSHEAHRQAINLSIIGDDTYEPNAQRYAIEGLRVIMEQHRKAGNAWITALAARHLPDGQWMNRHLEVAATRLLEFNTQDNGQCVERVNSNQKELWEKRGVRFFLYGSKLRASQPLPIGLLPSQDFHWQRDLFTVDGFLNSADTRLRHSGLSFLAPYWLLRQQDFIGDSK